METYESIRMRLQQNISGQYNCSPEELPEESRLFINAMAREMDALYLEQRRSDDHIKKHLLKRLQPEKDFRPTPEHGIVHAQPKKKGVVLKAEGDIFTADRLGNQANSIYFSPLVDTPLVNAKVKYIASGKHMKVYETPMWTEEKLDALAGKGLHRGELWLGIASDKTQVKGQCFSYYFDWKGVEEERKKRLYEELSLVNWYGCGKLLNSEPGFEVMPGLSEKIAPPLDTEQLFVYQLEQSIMQAYDHCFVQASLPPSSGFPDRLEEVFGLKNWATLEEQELSWVQLVFPASVRADEVEATSVMLNCFPVLNRKLNKKLDFTPSHDAETLSLNSTDRGEVGRGEYFLGVQQVLSKTAAYEPVMHHSLMNAPPGTYALQQGRLEADDARDLMDRIRELMRVINDKASLLQLQNKQNYNQPMEQIKTNLKKLDAALANQPNYDQDVGYYLHIKVLDPREMIYIRFWVTQGAYANEVLNNTEWLKTEKRDEIENQRVLVMSK